MTAAEWHQTEVPRSGMKELMRCTDRHALRDRSIWSACRKVLPVLMRQLRGEDVFLVRKLPESVRPYREELHDAVRA